MRANVDPQLWGPPAWEFLKYCAEACDDATAPSYKKFIELLPEVLPCEQCRHHSSEYISSNPVDTSNLKDWIERFKRAVSMRKAREAQQAIVGQSLMSRPCENSCNKNGVPRGLKLLGIICFIILLALAFAILLVALTKLTKAG